MSAVLETHAQANDPIIEEQQTSHNLEKMKTENTESGSEELNKGFETTSDKEVQEKANEEEKTRESNLINITTNSAEESNKRENDREEEKKKKTKLDLFTNKGAMNLFNSALSKTRENSKKTLSANDQNNPIETKEISLKSEPIHLSELKKRTNSKKTDNIPTKQPIPPSRINPTATIRVDGFVRPFNVKEAQKMIEVAGGGTLIENGFWMDHIKTHCYATFKSIEYAERARTNLYNQIWPECFGKPLKVEFSESTTEQIIKGQQKNE